MLKEKYTYGYGTIMYTIKYKHEKYGDCTKTRESWYDILREAFTLGPLFILTGLIGIIIGDFKESFCYIIWGLLGLVAGPFVAIWAAWDQYCWRGYSLK